MILSLLLPVTKNPNSRLRVDSNRVLVLWTKTTRRNIAKPVFPKKLVGHKGLAALLKYLIEMQIYE